MWWDGELEIARTLGDVLGVSEAWDVYLLYEAGGAWGEAGPGDPDFYMHQLYGLDTDRYLDPEGFQAELEARNASTETMNIGTWKVAWDGQKAHLVYYEVPPETYPAMGYVATVGGDAVALTECHPIHDPTIASTGTTTLAAFSNADYGPQLYEAGHPLRMADQGGSLYSMLLAPVGDEAVLGLSNRYDNRAELSLLASGPTQTVPVPAPGSLVSLGALGASHVLGATQVLDVVDDAYVPTSSIHAFALEDLR